MEVGEFFLALSYFILGVGTLVLSGFFIYWQIKFIVTVPRQLKRIAEALEKIAQK
jgi:hypothetical protein